VRQLVIKVLNIVDARCNHEVCTLHTLHSPNRAPRYIYLRITKEMHTFLINLFLINYPLYVSNK